MHEQHEKDEICFVGSEYAPEGGGGGGWGFDDEGVAQLRKVCEMLPQGSIAKRGVC